MKKNKIPTQVPNQVHNPVTDISKLLSILGTESTGIIFEQLLAQNKHALVQQIIAKMQDLTSLPHQQAREILQSYKSLLNEEKEIYFDHEAQPAPLPLPVTQAKAEYVLSTLAERTLALIIQREQAQVSAVIFALLPVERQARIMPMVSSELQVELVVRTATLPPLNHENLQQLISILEAESPSNWHEHHRDQRITEMAALINKLPEKNQQALLLQLQQTDLVAYTQIKKAMFTFTDIVNLDAAAWVHILKEIPIQHWPLALKNMPLQFHLALFKFMPLRMRKLIEEEISELPLVPLSKIVERQDEILKKILTLKDRGVIKLSAENDSDPLV